MNEHLIKTWHAAEAGLWQAIQQADSVAFWDSLKQFCSASDAVRDASYSQGHREFARDVDGYKEAIHVVWRRALPVGVAISVRDFEEQTLVERGRCQSALNQLAHVASKSAATGPDETVVPKTYLLSWKEILEALDLKHKESRRRVATLNETYEGPIALPSKGGQPKVERGALLRWWNSLEDMYREVEGRRIDKEETVKDSHNYGRDARVIPHISGRVKKRRNR